MSHHFFARFVFVINLTHSTDHFKVRTASTTLLPSLAPAHEQLWPALGECQLLIRRRLFLRVSIGVNNEHVHSAIAACNHVADHGSMTQLQCCSCSPNPLATRYASMLRMHGLD